MQTTAPQEVRLLYAPDKSAECRRELDIPWFDSNLFLDCLRPNINLVRNKRFSIFSMRDGYVYVQPNIMWLAIKKVAGRVGEEAPFAIEASGNEQDKKDLLFSVVQRLRYDRDAIANDLIKPGFFSAFFVVTYDDGHQTPGCPFVPFTAAAFDALPGELEALKPALLLKIKSIKGDSTWRKR